MSAWELPTSLEIGGVGYSIRTDFRAILDILKYFNDPDYEVDEQWEICLIIMYEDYDKIPLEHKQEAAEKARDFIDMGIKDDGKKRPSVMDWEQDAPIIIPAINRVLGSEVRACPNMHWWTFLSAYMEIRESLFSEVLNIRQKKANKKKLEKWEQDFYRENKDIIDLKKKYSAEEMEEQEKVKALLDGW